MMLVLALLVVGVGGAKGVTLNASFQTPASNASWNAGTNTYTWTGSTNNLMTMFSFSKGELAMYSKIHLEVAQSTHHNFRFTLMNGSTKLGEVVCWSSGTKDITFATHENTKNVDLSQVTDIAFGGSEDPGTGNSFSCVLTNVYLEGPATGYEVEYEAGTPLSLASVVSGSTLVTIGAADESILYGKTSDNQIYRAAINNAMALVSGAGSSNSTYQFRIIEATDDGLVYPAGVTTLYRIKAFKGDGTTPYTGPGWNGGQSYYLQDIGWTYNVSDGTATDQANFFAIAPVPEKDNTYKITSYKKDGTKVHDNIYEKSEWFFYVLGETIVPEKKVVAANDNIFAMSKFSEGKWTFADPVSLYDWDYLVIATENTAANVSHQIILKDESGKTVGGDAYKGEAVGTGAGMWLDYWNSQNIIAIDLNQLRRANGLDVFKIKSLEITGDIKPSVVYLTDYANAKITNRGRWTLYVEGDVVRSYSATDKFGTICLPYKASYAGAKLYEITGGGSYGISLEKVAGLLEPGKAYFYMSSDENGQDNGNTVRNVHFFRADNDTYDASDPVPNNGLIGTFSAITAPASSDVYVLSNNRLYDTEGSTVTIGANKAYIDMSQVPTGGGAARDIMLYFGDADETTGIADMSSQKADVKAIYNLQGQRVNRLQKGLNIVNGKKVLMK